MLAHHDPAPIARAALITVADGVTPIITDAASAQQDVAKGGK
jgi:hypothetical protein